MAIAPTGAIYKSLIFDGESSRNYGVYITGQAVYNAPEREVEMISIPGRNGQFALDKGRFENIEVTYPAGIFADSETDFAEAISDFRNLLCSRRGYVRLTDEYNPNEYRMAIYKSGLEVEPALLRAGEFEIVFDCKPQRYLTSGETEISVSSGDTITNPTLFDASPLFEVEGYGLISLNNDTQRIELTDDTIGYMVLSEPTSGTAGFSEELLNVGDTITAHNYMANTIRFQLIESGATITSITWEKTTNNISGTYSYDIEQIDSTRFNIKSTFTGDKLFTAGTASSASDLFRVTVNYTKSDSTTATAIRSEYLTAGYSITTIAGVRYGAIRLSTQASGEENGIKVLSKTPQTGQITAISTQSILGHPTYIDCDLGEAYKYINNVPVSLNGYIDLGSNLPKLVPGVNKFILGNNITDLKVVPRWWKV